MPKEFHRTDRVAGQLQRELARIIEREIKDPRLTAMTTVSAVKVARDMSTAKVYITVFGDEQQRQDALDILNKASGFMRRDLGKRLKMRVIPHLKFVYDSSLEYGNHIAKLIGDVGDSDDGSSEESSED